MLWLLLRHSLKETRKEARLTWLRSLTIEIMWWLDLIIHHHYHIVKKENISIFCLPCYISYYAQHPKFNEYYKQVIFMLNIITSNITHKKGEKKCIHAVKIFTSGMSSTLVVCRLKIDFCWTNYCKCRK